MAEFHIDNFINFFTDISMVYYFIPGLLSAIGGSLAYKHNMTEINIDSFDAKFIVSILIVAVNGISWPKRQMDSRPSLESLATWDRPFM